MKQILILTALCLLLSAASAEGQPKPTAGKLSRSEAIRLGATRNLALLAERVERQRQALLPQAARVAYIPMLVLNGSFDAAAGDNQRQRRFSYGTGVTWSTPLGTRVEAGLAIDQRLSAKLSGATNGVNAHSGALSLSATQPLLKGAWRSGAATPLAEAEIDLQIQRELFRAQLDNLLLKVEGAYWQLALAQSDVAIKTRSQNRAKKQYEDTRENIRRGILADVEIYVVEENLVYFEQALIRAGEQQTLARRQLARLLNVDPSAPLIATDLLEHQRQREPARAKMIRRALRANPSIRTERLRLKRSNVRLAFDKNQALPALDLSASLSLNGLDESYGPLHAQMWGAERVDARVGLSLAIPLWWSANRASVQRSRLGVKRQLLQLKDRESKVRFAVSDLFTQLDAQRRRLSLAKRQVRLARLKLDAEAQKYRSGISTLADVVRFQRELDEADISLKRAQVNAQSLHARLLATAGRLHEARGVSLGGDGGAE